MLQQQQAVGNTVSDLSGLEIELKIFTSRGKHFPIPLINQSSDFITIAILNAASAHLKRSSI